MKPHLPTLLRAALLLSLFLPAQAALTWNSGDWNTTDASWLENAAPAVFSNGDDVEFTPAATSTSVLITETVEPGSVLISGSGFVFSGAGSIDGSGGLTLLSGASLVVENANAFTGGTVVNAGASVTINQYDSLGTNNAVGTSFGPVSGAGQLVVNLADASTPASIFRENLADFTGTLYVQRGNVALGRAPQHAGAGQDASFAASRVNVGTAGTFTLTLGGGVAGLVTNKSFASEVRTENGATIGNRDGHVNWSGDVYLNMQDVTAATPVYNEAASTVFAMYYSKFIVWDGVVNGAGELALSAGNQDVGGDHRLVLTNNANTFTGAYHVRGEYLSSLALAAENAAAGADVQLDAQNSRLVLMNTSATIGELNGPAGVVMAEGSSACVLTLSGGNYAGAVKDSSAAVAGLSLGITKVGSGALQLSGTNCTYTGKTTVMGGNLQFTGDTSLGSVDMAAGTRLTTGGNLTLRPRAALSFDLTGTGGAAIQSGGSLSLSGISHGVSVSGYESLGIGSYELMSWSNPSSVSTENFVPGNLNDTAELVYSLVVEGNALKLVVGDMDSVSWLWSGNSAAWADDSAAQWSNASGSGPAGQQVTFSVRNAGTVTIDRVTPADINVIGGAYTFAPASEASEGIVSNGILTVSGEATVLNMNLDNAQFTGSTVLQGGVLVLGSENALGSSSLYFNGGQLRYASGISTDVSEQVHSDSVSPVRVDTNGNDVSWENNSGVQQVLSSGIEKSGEGTLALTWAATGDTRSGAISVLDGTLQINKVSGNGTLTGGYSGTGTLGLTSAAGQLTVTGDNSAFAGTVLLSGDGSSTTGSVSFASGASIGGAGTLVKVAGQRFWFAESTSTAANFEMVEGTSTYFDGSSGRSYTFTGTISGSGDLRVKPSCSMTMTGDVSRFTGTFVHPGSSAVTWQFGGEGVAGSGLVQANLDSPGANASYVFWYSDPTTLSGVVSGTANLRQRGSGALTLTGQNTSTGNLTIDEGSEVRLGSAAVPGSWAGATQLGAGQFTLVNGTLQNPLTTMEGTLVADVAAGGVVNMGGMDGNMLQSVSVGAGGQLAGMEGNLTIGGAAGVDSLYLTLGSSNLGAAAAPAEGEQYMLSIANGNLQIADSTVVTLDMESVKDILSGKRQAVYLHIADTEIELQNGMTAADLFANSATSPEALGLVVLGIDGGNIVLEGAVRDVYMVMQDGDYDTVTDYTRLQPYKATFVDSGYTLSLNLPGDNTQQAWVNNLLGGGNLAVTNTNESSGVVRVLLNNEVLTTVDGVLTPEQDIQINTANTEFQGNISAGAAVQLVKTGSGTLTVGGTLTADWLEIDEGTLRLTGQGNTINTLHGDGALALEGAMELDGNATAFEGALSGSGALILNGVMNGAGSIGSLSGNGELRASGSTFTVQNLRESAFSGSLADGSGSGTLVVENGGARFSLNQVQSTRAWSVENRGNTTFVQSGAGDNSVLTLDSLRLLDGSDSVFVFDTDKNAQVFNLNNLLVQDGASVTLQSSGSLPVSLSDEGTMVLGQVEAAELGSDGRVPVTLGSGTPFRGIESAWLTVENGMLIFNSRRDTRNQYALKAASANARAGAGLMWELPNSLLRESPDLAALTQALDAATGRSADRLLAASAGAGVAALGVAAMGDLERQLKAIRNRSTSMGLDPQMVYDDLPLFNAWVNAEGDHRELKADGTDSGYSLGSWGATVGVDVDFSPSFTAGIAFTGMYGDFQAKSPDHAEGDMDHYYLTLFGRYAARRWTHTLVAAVGWADVSLNRHVNFPGGSYRTHGSTDGNSFGFLYELGYVIPLDEDNNACLQPIFNISYRHIALDSFTERGSDAALHFGSQEMDTVSFGLGARAQTYALENMLNRRSLLEARMLLKVDAGDVRSNADIALRALRSRTGRVRSAEMGRVGLEMGAGISVPVGVDYGYLFLDGSFEFRADMMDINGTVGYRLSF